MYTTSIAFSGLRKAGQCPSRPVLRAHLEGEGARGRQEQWRPRVKSCPVAAGNKAENSSGRIRLQDRERNGAYPESFEAIQRTCRNGIVLFLFQTSIPKGTLSHNALLCLGGKQDYSGRAEKAT